MVFIIILGWTAMKNNYKIEFQNYHNFLAYKRKLKDMPYKFTEKTRKCVLSPVRDIVDYDGIPFTIGLMDKELQDFFVRLYCIEYQTELRILPA